MAFCGYFTPRVPGEKPSLSLDFARRMLATDTISAAVVAVSVAPSSPVPDPAAASLLVGSPGISGTVVSQLVGGTSPSMQPGVEYVVTFTVTLASGVIIIMDGHIKCITPL